MAVTITRLSKEDLDKEFKRPSNKTENLGDYLAALDGLTVGDGFTVRIAEATKDGKLVEVVPDSGDGESVDTMRAFKRRMNTAADTLNFSLKWKPKGHRVGEGDNARFVTDWLAVRVDETKPVKTKAASNGAAK
jgi:hypothetical protein